MQIIKLNATESTNTFLKEMVKTETVQDYTVVWALNQTKGRGQMDGRWQTDPGKNLTFSVLKKVARFPLQNHFVLNMTVSLAILKTLLEFQIPRVKVKWPNDIMSGSLKICGILIENSVLGSTIKSSVIGIGLNVNQTDFPENPKATSLRCLTGLAYDLEILLQALLQNLKKGLEKLEMGNLDTLFMEYHSHLFKKDIASTFKKGNGEIFNGIILGVSKEGKLTVQKEDNHITEFDIKEISLLY